MAQFNWPLTDGYKQRNTDIATALESPNHVAVVTDLKQFYPSAKNETVKDVLKSRISQVDIKSNLLYDAIHVFYSQLLDTAGEGIPIGPASSHVLGHIILQDVDSELTSKYGNKYFRYVDDIVVVCHQRDEDAVKQDIQNCIENHGFAINTEKTAVITGADWQHHILRADGSDEDNLWQMCSDLAKYLAFHPDRADVIKKIFADEGLCIPVGRLLALSRYGPFRYFITRLNTPSVIKHAAELYFSTNDDFLQRGKRLKNVYERSLLELINAPAEQSMSFRRWQVERARRVINSLFYLRRFDEWENQSGSFEAFPELVEQRALAKALSNGVVNPILPFYGRGPAAFSELWVEYGQGYAALKPSETEISHAEIDGLITLRLFGVIPASDIPFSSENKVVRLLSIVNSVSSKRMEPDLSFDDEFDSLSLGISEQEISRLARTRYSPSEGSVLEALSLLNSEYRS